MMRLVELLVDLFCEAPCSRHEAYMRLAGRPPRGSVGSTKRAPTAAALTAERSVRVSRSERKRISEAVS